MITGRKFLNVCVRAPRGSHDAAHLRGSTLWQKLQSGELPSHKHQFKLLNKDIYPYLIGDSAYSLQKGLMKRFTTKSTTSNAKSLFDARWSARRVKIENAFGILKNKFQILNNLNANLKYASTIVTACCILHNFMIDKGGSSEIEIMDNELNSSWPFNLDYSREERLSETIAKEQQEILF